MRKIETRSWWPDLLAVKDELSLRDLAARFGATPGAIVAALKRNGLERKKARSGRRVLVRPPARQPEALAPYLDMLGAVPDDELASLSGVSIAHVRSARDVRGIAAVSEIDSIAHPKKPRPASDSTKRAAARPASRTGRTRGRPSTITPFEAQLGQVPDRVIAEKAGVTVSAVTLYRQRRGILSARAQGGAERRRAVDEQRASAVVVSPPVQTARHFGFRARSGEQVFVVLAANIVEAARRASALGSGEVDGIERIGPTL